MARSFLLLCAAALMAGCSVIGEVQDERFQRNNKAGDRWLSDQFEAAEVNVSGNWVSNDWGHGTLRQNGRNISGVLGGYNVTGILSGRSAYLLIADGEWYYYSAILEMPRAGVLTGRFSRAIPFVRGFSRPMRLDQLAH